MFENNATQFLRALQTPEAIFELVVIWVVVLLLYRFLRGTRGAGILRGLAVVLILLTAGLVIAGDTLERLNFLYSKFIGLLAMLLIVVFQPELRQGMTRLSELVARRAPQTDALLDQISVAVEFLSRSQFGALIVIERSVHLGGLVEGGVRLDAEISARLLQSIFYPNNPLHDLAVVLRGERVLAANVQLPLADIGVVPAELGSRHRAAVGITVEADCLVVIVSEENGAIRIAERGRLCAPIPRDQFRSRLAERLAASLATNRPEPDDSTDAAQNDAQPESTTTPKREVA